MFQRRSCLCFLISHCKQIKQEGFSQPICNFLWLLCCVLSCPCCMPSCLCEQQGYSQPIRNFLWLLCCVLSCLYEQQGLRPTDPPEKFGQLRVPHCMFSSLCCNLSCLCCCLLLPACQSCSSAQSHGVATRYLEALQQPFTACPLAWLHASVHPVHCEVLADQRVCVPCVNSKQGVFQGPAVR